MRTFIFALKGIKSVFQTEKNARVHLVISLFVVGCGVFSGISRLEWIAVFLCIGMVLAAEIFNTAIEKLVDVVSPGRNEKAGLIKDISAGAVLVTAVVSVAVGLCIFVPYLIDMIK